MGQTKLFDQALQALGLFQRVEVFTLHVFNQGHGGGGLVRHVTHQHRHFAQSRQFGSTKTPLTSNDFVFASIGTGVHHAHQNRLHDALDLDAFCQLVQAAFVHAGAWLVDTGHHDIQGQGGGCAIVCRSRCFIDCRAQQGLESSAQSFDFFGRHTCPVGQKFSKRTTSSLAKSMNAMLPLALGSKTTQGKP